PHSRTATVQLVLSLTPTGTITLNEGRTKQMTVGLSGPAPAGGVEVTLTSLDTGVFTVPAFVTVPAGQTSATFDVTALQQGDSQLTVSAVGAAAITRAVRIDPIPTLGLSTNMVGKDLQGQNFARLTVTPPEPTDLTVTIASDSTALLSTSPTTLGTDSLTFTGVTGTGWQGFHI